MTQYKLGHIGVGWVSENDFDELPDTKQFYNTRPTHIASMYSIDVGVYFSTNKDGSNVYVKIEKSEDEDHIGMTIVYNLDTHEFSYIGSGRAIYTNIYVVHPEYNEMDRQCSLGYLKDLWNRNILN